jgi:ABC-type branched-subunit amino acid transport system ATPase component
MSNSRSPSGAAPLLEVQALSKHFYGVKALDKVDMVIYPGELVSLIGPNGSGKTTFFNCVTGFLRIDGGRVIFKNQDITQQRPDKITLKGICRTFQNVRILPSLTVEENLLVALQQFQEDNLIKRAFHAPSIKKLEAESKECAANLMDQVELYHLRDQKANNLVYGQRKLLEFACALIPDPDLVMLDEPAAGVSTTMVDRMKSLIRSLNKTGKTFLVVEHNMGVVMDISDRIVVLDYGEKIAEGTPLEIRGNELVKEAYFGK